jgi:hypothetical protein
MDDPERPPLPQIRRDQIDLLLYKVDKLHWPHLAAMQVPHEIPPGEPRPPKMPGQLLNHLQWYASVLFTREVEQYGSFGKDYRYPMWLSRLAGRIVARVVDAVEQIDKGNKRASLQYHGLLRDEMVAGLTDIVSALVKKYVWEQSPEFLDMKAKMAERPAVLEQPAPPPPPVDDTDRQADRKALRDSYLASFPDVGIMDICWAAKQHYREWSRWLNNELKRESKPDRAFRHVLTSGKPTSEIRRETRPKGWK